MNWKIRFRELTGWRPKNDEERTKNDEEFPQNRLGKRLGSASSWIFFTKAIFLTNFEWFLNTRRAAPIYSAPLPLFIGENGEVVIAQLAQASWFASTRSHRPFLEDSGWPKWAKLLFTPLFTKYTPLLSFFLSISFQNVAKLYGLCNNTCLPSETSRNFTDYATMLVLTSEILQNFTDYATMLVLTSGMLWNFMDYATMLVLTSRMLRNFTDYATMFILRVPKGANKVQKPTASIPGRN